MISVNDLKYTTVFIADNTEEPRHSFTGFIIKLATSQGESYFLVLAVIVLTKIL